MLKYFYPLGLFVLLFSCQKTEHLVDDFALKSNLIDSLGQRYFVVNRFSGTILVAQNDTLLYHQNFGLADYENKIPFSSRTAFKIGEVSHYFIAQIITELEKRDKLSRKDKLSKYFPDLKPDFTIDQLLKHQAGLPAELTLAPEQPNTANLIKQINGLELTPGKAIRSHLAYELLGMLIETLTGSEFEAALNSYLQHHQLEHTFHQKIKADLAQAYAGFNNQGQGLERERLDTAPTTPVYIHNGIKASARDVWKIMQVTSATSAAGYLPNDGYSYSVDKADSGQIIIVLSNYRHPVAEEMLGSIQAILQGNPFELPLLREPIQINTDLLPGYAGVYEINPSFTFKIISSRDSLYVEMFGEKNPLIPQAADQFFLLDNDASMRFVREADSTVSAVILYDGFLEGNLVKKVE